MKILLLALFCLGLQAHAHTSLLTPVSYNQSSPSIDWRVIESDSLKLIYPDYMGPQAQFITNLVQHYSGQVGLDYGIAKPQKFPLIIRPEFAELNGFVTLMPRRSEWYTSATISPVIGALNFYQALAIHEYRHIIQYDYMKRSTNKFAYAIFGEFGLALAYVLGVPPWFFEGDAVYAETKYTDAGRGRSPRFAARLKALVLNDAVPTYDEFLGRTYTTYYPNHYVFGYYLVSAAYQKYGQDFWRRVLDSVTGFSFNPYAITNAFRAQTGKDFEDFYDEVMKDLKTKWANPAFKKSSGEYTETHYPIIDGNNLYYVKRTLNDHWGIYRYGKDEAEVELPLAPQMSKIDIKNGLVAYTQYLPSPRFAFKSYSDLFTYNLATGERTHLLEDDRVFHPAFSPDGKLIAVTEYTDDNHWYLKIVDLNGKMLQRVAILDEIITEAVWVDQTRVLALIQNPDGSKVIKEFNLAERKTRTLINTSKNNVFSLRYHQQKLYFEADYKGSVQIMALDTTAKGQLSLCSDEVIAAYNPFATNSRLYYASVVASGSELKSIALNCKPISRSTLESYDYLGDTASDNYTKLPLQKFSDFNKTVENKFSSSEYSEFTDRLMPHSWSFISGRGYDLSITGNNYLNSFGYNIGFGQSAEEEQPFAYASFSFNKYYPIFSFNVDYSKREDEDDITKVVSNWEELEGYATVTLPYSFQIGLYQNYFEVSGRYGLMKYTRDRNSKVYELSDERLDIKGVEVVASSLKETTFRQIYPSYGFRYIGIYQDAEAKNVKSFSSDVFYQNLDLYLPGLFHNDGFKISGFSEKQKSGVTNYRFEPFGENFTSYVLSRGFKYSYVDQYQKASIDYLFPIAYTDWDLNGWAYLRRIYAKVFYDHTKIKVLSFERSLNSAGSELLFETYLLRKFDLNMGVRYSYKVDQDEVYDFILATGFSF